MPKPFRTLLDTMPRDRRKRIRAATDVLEQEMDLSGLRLALGLTQVELAEALGVNQAALSKLERQRDVRVSTLRRLLRTLGAELKLVARFPDREVEITQFRGPDQD